MTEKAIIKRLVLGLVPLDKRDHAHSLWDEVEYRLGGWTQVSFFFAWLLGCSQQLDISSSGSRFRLALGIFAGITEIIPFFGPIIGGTAATMIALTNPGKRRLS